MPKAPGPSGRAWTRRWPCSAAGEFQNPKRDPGRIVTFGQSIRGDVLPVNVLLCAPTVSKSTERQTVLSLLLLDSGT